MAKVNKISLYNQRIEVKKLTETVLEDGNTMKDWSATRFVTDFANIENVSSVQFYANGMSAKETLYRLTFHYSAEREIVLSDKILWGGKTLLPVGGCEVEDLGNKKFFKQLVKHIRD